MIRCVICPRPASGTTRRLNEYGIRQPLCAPCAALVRAVVLPAIHEAQGVGRR